MLRQVIVTIMGNVDAGKSQTIDSIKKTSIVESEPGRITQSIRAYAIPLHTIQDICKHLSDFSKIKIPGLLFLDTPGHHAFSNLRKRGGALADIAILVVDINEGLKPQTLESIEILKQAKTPFIIALNKIDTLNGWHAKKDPVLIKNITAQQPHVQQLLDTRLYELVAKLYELGFQAERYDRVSDYTKQLAIIPMSAKTSEGIPELLMTVTGLAQRFLETALQYEKSAPAHGTILEITEERGLGTTLDTIIYDGTLNIGDQILIGTLHEPVLTKVKTLMLVEKGKLSHVKTVSAAIGVKVIPQNADDIIPGMPLLGVGKDLHQAIQDIKEEVKTLTLELDNEGIIIKADSLGSLEALILLLREKNIKIKRASIGKMTKKDIAEAQAEANPLYQIILAFNVEPLPGSPVKIISSNVIYTLLEEFETWKTTREQELETSKLKNIIWPCKFQILPGYIFRQSNPLIVGVDILAGVLKPNTPVMKDGRKLTDVKGLQKEGENVSEAKKGESVAISLPHLTLGRQVQEGDILYTDIPERDFRHLKTVKNYLKADEIQTLKEIAEIHRTTEPAWGM